MAKIIRPGDGQQGPAIVGPGAQEAFDNEHAGEILAAQQEAQMAHLAQMRQAYLAGLAKAWHDKTGIAPEKTRVVERHYQKQGLMMLTWHFEEMTDQPPHPDPDHVREKEKETQEEELPPEAGGS